jgi:SAM-dependent methyltransferase
MNDRASTSLDHDLQYEDPSLFFKILRLPLIPILNLLPSVAAQKVFLAFANDDSPRKTIFAHATSYEALEALYLYPQNRGSLMDDFWDAILFNSCAVRNRRKLVTRNLVEIALLKIGSPEVVLASVGCGSARPVIEAASLIQSRKSVVLHLVDINKRALQYALQLAQEAGLLNVHIHRGAAQHLRKNTIRPHVIEMVGLLDYFEKREAIRLVRSVYESLQEGGLFLTSNIVPNMEAPFIKKG